MAQFRFGTVERNRVGVSALYPRACRSTKWSSSGLPFFLHGLRHGLHSFVALRLRTLAERCTRSGRVGLEAQNRTFGESGCQTSDII
jgi:hypothetical protein